MADVKTLLGNTWLIPPVAAACAGVCRLWLSTVRCDRIAADPTADPWTTTRGNIFCLWHESMLPGACFVADRGIRVLVSQSRDGELITQFIQRFGFDTVRGSSSRGAVRAVRELARSSDSTNLAITPDGPKGPRRQFQPGAVFLASRTGLPLVPLGFAFSSVWRLNSWDRFALPRPFSRVVIYVGEPLYVPPDANAAELEQYLAKIVTAMDSAERYAEDYLHSQGGQAESPDVASAAAAPASERTAA